MLTVKRIPEKNPAPGNRNIQDIAYRKGVLRLSQRTHVMGILNRTPDSFSDGGNFLDEAKALGRIEQMVADGADIIDIGGESTRPGAPGVSLAEELERVIPVIRKAAARIPVPISVDTRRSEVADAAIEAGAAMVNDITALRGDPRMRYVIARGGVPVVLMHMKGTPRTMQANPEYTDLIQEIISYLEESIEIGGAAGIPEEKMIIDPGIGFGKTTEHNLSIIKNLERFRALGKPILIGTSRKSFIGNVLGLGVDRRLMGTAASVAAGILNGARIVRVHDVKQMAEVVRLTNAIARSA